MGDGLATLKFTLQVDGQGNVVGAMKDVEAATTSMSDKTVSTTGRMASETEAATGRMAAGCQNLIDMAKAAAATFAAWKLSDFIKDVALLAARYETLGVVMEVVGNNSGYTSTQMHEFQKGLQQTGISAVESRQGLALMGQAQVDMAKSAGLARVAQDAAVIANTNSSDAFNRMMTGISTGQAIILHHMGLMVNFEGSYKSLAETLGKSKEDLTAQELTQARVNEVMRVSVGIAGSYDAAMGTTGKALTSLKRYSEDAKVALGEAFSPALKFLVDELTRSLKDAGNALNNNKSGIKSFGDDLGRLTSGSLTYFKEDLIKINALILDMKSGLYLLGAVAALPGAVAGTDLVKRMLAESKGYADMATEQRAYLESVKAAAGVKGPILDPSEQGRANSMKDEGENARIAAGIKLRAEAAAAAKKAADEKAAQDARDLAEKQAAYNKQLLDSEAALKQQYAANAKQLEDSALKDRIAQLQYEKDAGLKTTQEFLDAKYAMERAAWQKELEAANAVAHARYLAYAAVSNDPGADEKMQNEAEKEYVKSLGEALKIKEKMDAATSQKPRDDAKEDLAKQHFSSEMAIQQLQAIGATMAAVNAANDLKYSDLKQKGYTKEQIDLQKINDAISIQTTLYKQQIALRKTLDAMQAANDATAASMVGTNAKGGFDTIADQTANQLAVQQQAHEARLKMIDDEKNAQLVAMMSGEQSYADYASQVKKLDEQTALERQKNSKATGKIADDSYRATLSMAGQYTSMAGQFFTALADTQDQTSRKGFETAKAFNIGAAVMSTAAAIMNALATVQPYPLAIAASVLAAATGAIQIAKISSTSFGGGSGSISAPSGSYGAMNGSTGNASGQGYFTGGADPSVSGVGSSIGESLNTALQNLVIASNKNTLALGQVAVSISLIGKAADSTVFSHSAPGQFTGISDQPTYMSDMIKSLFTFGSGLGSEDPITALGHALFGSSNWGVTGAGLSLGVQGGNFSGGAYTDYHKEGGLFTSSENQTGVAPLDKGTEDWFKGQIEAIKSNVTAAASIMGTSTTDLANVAITSTKIATAGRKTEDIQKDVDAWVTSIESSFAKTIKGLDAFTQAGETAGEAYLRLATAAQGVKEIFALTGNTLEEVSLKGADLASSLVTAYGGLDKLQKANQDFVDAVYTPAEDAAYKAAASGQQVSAAFASIGLAVPKTNAELIALRQGLDTSTASGLAMWQVITNIGPAFADVTKQVSDLKAATDSFNSDLASRAMTLAGDTVGASLNDLMVKQQAELEKAILDGMDVTRLKIVQEGEWAAAVAKATGVVTATLATLEGTSKTAATDMLTAQANIATALKGMMTSNLSPLDAYTQAEKDYQAVAGKTDLKSLQALPAAAQALMTASQNWNGTGAGFQSDQAMIIAAMNSALGLDPSAGLDKVQAQINLLGDIKSAVDAGTTATVSQLTTYLGASSPLVGALTGWVLASLAVNNADMLSANTETALRAAALGTLPKFASGGIATDTSIAGEGDYNEAIIPLPDGRTVPVRLIGSGSGNNKGVEDRLDQVVTQIGKLTAKMDTMNTNMRLVVNR